MIKISRICLFQHPILGCSSLTTMGPSKPAASGCKSVVTHTLPEGLIDINIHLLTREPHWEPHTTLVEQCVFAMVFGSVHPNLAGNDQV